MNPTITMAARAFVVAATLWLTNISNAAELGVTIEVNGPFESAKPSKTHKYACNHDGPTIMLWLERLDPASQRFKYVRTLHVFSKDKRYYHELKLWARKSRWREAWGKKNVIFPNDQPPKRLLDIDAVSGPTIRWQQTRSVNLPLRAEEAAATGDYRIVIEQNSDKFPWREAKRAKRRIIIPLKPEGLREHDFSKHSSFIKSVKLTTPH